MDRPARSHGRPGHDPFATFRSRLVAQFSTAAWLVVVVKVVSAQAQSDGTRVPDHWLAAAWTPLAGGPTRWPEAVVIGSPAADNAIAELCTRLPDDARLNLVDPDAVDAVLAAQILLAADRNLEPYHRNGLTAFMAAERARIAARVSSSYTDHDPRFAAFRDALTTTVRGRPGTDDGDPA